LAVGPPISVIVPLNSFLPASNFTSFKMDSLLRLWIIRP